MLSTPSATMEDQMVKQEDRTGDGSEDIGQQWSSTKSKSRSKNKDSAAQGAKRRCVSSACIACRKRKSKCDGNLPSCAACSSVYHTPCIYDPNSDHRRKGVYKQDIDNLKNRNTTLQTLVQAILNYDEEDVPQLVRQIRSCQDLGEVAESIVSQERSRLQGIQEDDDAISDDGHGSDAPQFESELTGKMSEMKFEGAVKFVGGTSNLIFLPSSESEDNDEPDFQPHLGEGYSEAPPADPITLWTEVTKDTNLIRHLLTMYFTWHYAYFTTLSKELFYHDFVLGQPSQYCSSLLVNAMLALGCHFSDLPAAREVPNDSATAGDQFFKEAKRLILENDEHERAKLCTVQALALMSVREAGCGREGSGWVYSGMSFRMAYDLGLNMDVTSLGSSSLSDKDVDARRITFWGCFLFDKCWSNYLGRQPQLSGSHLTVPKFEIFAEEDAETWAPYTDSGAFSVHSQPSRTRAVALQISRLCEISNDLLASFYHPAPRDKPMGKQEELRRLSQLHTRLEVWRKELPNEFEPKDGQLPPVLLMHMFFQLLFIHLYRPFLKYTKTTSPLPAQTSPRKQCTQAASVISKLLRTYKRSYGLRQICNVAVYVVHSACTIHLLNLPDKGAQRDIVHGLKNLEEIAEGWLCARRTIHILEVLTNKWNVSLPDEAAAVFQRSRSKFGSWKSTPQTQSPHSSGESPRDDQTTDSISIPHSDSPVPPYHAGPRAQTQPASLGSVIAQHPEASPSSSGTPYPQAPYLHPTTPERQLGPQTHPSSAHSARMRPVDPQHSIAPGMDPGIASDNQPYPQVSALSGVENLLLGSQNWWYRDQSSLALGLGNWDTEIWESPSSQDAGNPGMNLNLNNSSMAPTAASTLGGYGNTPQMMSSNNNNLYDASPMNMGFDVSVAHAGYGDGYMIANSGHQSMPAPARRTSQLQQPLAHGNDYDPDDMKDPPYY